MIDKKWKWLAKDADGVIYLYQRRPRIIGVTWSDSKDLTCSPESILWADIPFQWKDSLHEILHHEDGKIEFRKARPELKVDDPVLVKNNEGSQWCKAHFAGWDEDRIWTWVNGRTSFTAHDKFSWKYYKLP